MASFFRKFLQSGPPASKSPPAKSPQAEHPQPDAQELYAEASQAYQAKDFGRAISLCERIIALQPDHAEAYYKRGNALKDLGQPQAALASYDAAVQHKPDFQYAWCNRGFIQQSLGLHEAALGSFDQAIKLNPDDIITHANRGSLLQGMSRWREALASHDRVLALNPQLFQTWLHRGNVLRELRQLEAALASHRKALELKPDCAEAHYNCGVLLELMQQPEAALASYDHAIESYPQFHQAHYNRAGLLKKSKQPQSALAAYERTIAIKPDYAEAHANRGTVLHELERWDEALASYDRALALRPNFAEAHTQRAYTLGATGRYEAALADYHKAVAIKPDFAEAQWNRSMTMLLLGDYENGWLNYEWRWRNPANLLTAPRDFERPLWLGKEPIAGKSVLIHHEQGLGDTLQFCRFAKSVADLGATVFLEVQAPLADLLQSLDGISRVIAAGSPLPEFDYHCPMMSLPLALKTTLHTIPGASRYLRADPAKVAYWRTRMGERRRPCIGLAWSGNSNQVNDSRRSFRLDRWIKQLPRDFQYVCLQKDIRPEDRETLAANSWISIYDEALRDFDNTAALCECVDLVISVCTSIAHLSGALGRPTWVLLPFDADFRWLHAGVDSPWYQSATLYRQQAIGDWNSLLARVAVDLRKLYASAA
jgi:tetratricopeptide (TPR) repeat protein